MTAILSPFAGASAVVTSPSGDTTGKADAARINAAVTALGSAGGTVTLGPGKFYLVPGAVVINPAAVPVNLTGAGIGATIINAVAGTAGDTLRMFNPTANIGGGSGGIFGGGVQGLTIDGTNAAAGSSGLHIGDSEGMTLDVCCQNFNGVGSKGCWIDNTIWWTEKMRGRVFAWNNTANVVLDQSGTGASVQTSHAYCDLDIYIEAEQGQDGLVLQGGANFYNGALRVRGDFNTGSTSNAALRITGTAAHGLQTGQFSKLSQSSVDFQVESDGASNFPQTVNLGSQSGFSQNAIINCYGSLAFFGTWTASNTFGTQFNTGVVTFAGTIIGDTTLGPAPTTGVNQAAQTIAGPLLYGQGNGDNTGPVPTQAGDFFSFQLANNVTLNLVGYLTNAQQGPQRKTIVIKQAGAGSKTVTWQHNVSPTISSPTVLWAGGTPPTMTAAANAIDVYDLETVDGITWYGRATQNVS